MGQDITIYVGRIIALNSIQVGKVLSPSQKVMNYAWGGSSRSTSMYEVLVCEKNDEQAAKAEIAKLKLELKKRSCSNV